MGTDAGFAEFSGLKFEDEIDFPDLHQYPTFTNGYKSNDPTFDIDFNFVDTSLVLLDSDPSRSAPSSVATMEGDSPSDDSDFSETVLNYISQMLMEEDMEQKPCMFHDPLALQAAERSLYDVLGEKYPSSPNQSSSFGDQFLVDSPDDGLSSRLSDYSSNSSSGSNTSSSAEQQWINGEFGECKPAFLQTPLPTNFVFQSSANSSSQQPLKLKNGLANNAHDVMGSFESKIVVPNFFSERELALQFQRGVEEANRFLPKENQLVIDLETNASIPEMKEKNTKVVVKEENEETEYSPISVKGRKNREREDDDFDEERSNKQSAVYVDETELAEMFDKVLVCTGGGCRPPGCILSDSSQSGSNKALQQNGQTNGSNGGKARAKRQGNKKEVVDLRTLLILCAQAVSSDDRRTANEILKQIRQHSSPFGDGSQRLAHCFANGLEARLAGTGAQIYTALSSEKLSAADMLKAYLAYISACPFNKIAIIFANHNILAVSKNASTLHIIDFGILYGFQWPALIYRLSKREGGPPKLRITGIELPQSGFRPGERVQETGRRLAKYCELHKVPFEYNAIAKKWETIQIDDLKLNHGEVVAVNCLFRSKNLLDETVVVNSPRNAVLNLIRKMSPDIFIHAIVNGSYSAPFFVTRFRESLFHFSALFDMFDTNMSREDQMRLKFEKEFYGREALNVIACEGSERVERPETYKQWQVRSLRAGLKQLPLEPQLLKKLKCRVKEGYHNDFVVDQDGQWMLQGWKGRIIYASSAWVPA
ncbi:scarecrow-like protein 14 [Ricinus communis]|uniref:scarecrow-like protein 14 n=1 Tax=Ricinus communis TaxID=3988 RepID=UPI00201B1B6A|nr:scarecrow-like protein 14 [Ricinus communis]